MKDQKASATPYQVFGGKILDKCQSLGSIRFRLSVRSEGISTPYQVFGEKILDDLLYNDDAGCHTDMEVDILT